LESLDLIKEKEKEGKKMREKGREKKGREWEEKGSTTSAFYPLSRSPLHVLGILKNHRWIPVHDCHGLHHSDVILFVHQEASHSIYVVCRTQPGVLCGLAVPRCPVPAN
jgi:hypothetical protein